MKWELGIQRRVRRPTPWLELWVTARETERGGKIQQAFERETWLTPKQLAVGQGDDGDLWAGSVPDVTTHKHGTRRRCGWVFSE